MRRVAGRGCLSVASRWMVRNNRTILRQRYSTRGRIAVRNANLTSRSTIILRSTATNMFRTRSISRPIQVRLYSEDFNTEEGQQYRRNDPFEDSEKVAFIGGLPREATRNELLETFSRYGAVEARIIINKFSGFSRGFGFVAFDSIENVDKAIAEMNGAEFQGNPLKVNKSFGRRDRDDKTAGGRRIFIGNISWDSTREDIEPVLQQYGDVVSINLPTNRHTGRPRGFGFALFAEKSFADAALYARSAECNGRVLHFEPVLATNEAPARTEGAGENTNPSDESDLSDASDFSDSDYSDSDSGSDSDEKNRN
eukprot:TRINITY_DN14097_c0_g1_i1.p1 TRINITY_DN14097_c0_g1~~TRINITY_DN14097_c0_g1_i1.p1  ORF type:complete len:323 (+),score=45.88 TRINITY_DN14097_c0_g1_i1:37-969(+)